MEESTFKKLELSDEVLDGMENLLHVASDFTRLKIVYSIMNGEKCVSDIVRVVGAEQSLVSHQLKVLKNANLVTTRKEGSRVFYSLADDHVIKLLDVVYDHVQEKRHH